MPLLPHYSLVLVSLILMLLSGCEQYPRDPDDSLNRIIDRGVLRVGALPAEPWVLKSPQGQLDGAEGRLVRQFAHELGVDVRAQWLGEEAMFQMLGNHELDMVVGGLSQRNPWSAHAGFTVPYYTNRSVVGTPPQSPVLSTLKGITVGILPTAPLGKALEGKGAVVREITSFDGASFPVAGATWQLERYGFTPTGIALQTRKHVMAVPSGENALLMRLEAFLLDYRPEDIETLLNEASTP